MEIFKSLDDIKLLDYTGVALGNFDGIHLGHQMLISRAVKNAKTEGLKSMVFTFTNHPKNKLKSADSIKNIVSQEEKARVIKSLGVDYLATIEFTDEILFMPPEKFVKDILLDTLRMKEAHCGFHYRFGYKAGGNVKLLMKMGDEYNFGLHVLEAVKIQDTVVSSTLIRKLIAEGKMEECQQFLRRAYCVSGKVMAGNKLGHTIGFPTANISVDQSMALPPNGVYITSTYMAGKAYPSITNVGNKPTIGDNYQRNVETFIFDFDKNIYGKDIRIDFAKKMRSEIKFKSVEALKAQIKHDSDVAYAYHKATGAVFNNEN